jgi:hypothetical protein
MFTTIAGFARGGGAEDFRHVRSSNESLRAAFHTGYDQSPTFRTLMDQLETARVVVYVEPAINISGGREGELLHVVSGSPELPILRVLVRSGLGSRRTLSILAHELQHVVEASAGGSLSSSRAMQTAFGALDPEHAHGAQSFETDAARAVERRVLDELAAHK